MYHSHKYTFSYWRKYQFPYMFETKGNTDKDLHLILHLNNLLQKADLDKLEMIVRINHLVTEKLDEDSTFDSLGEGTFGQVYKAKRKGQPVAVKIMKKLDNLKKIQAFEREVDTLRYVLISFQTFFREVWYKCLERQRFCFNPLSLEGGLLQPFPFRIFPRTIFAFLLRLPYGQFNHPLSRYPCIYEKMLQQFLPWKKLGGGGVGLHPPSWERKGWQQK